MLGKIVRIIGIVLMALTAVFTLLGGAGTSCAAFAPTNPKWADSMGALAPYQWLYILFVFVTLAIGVIGVQAVFLLIFSKPGAYRAALIALLSGTVFGVIHILVSRALRGKSMPVDMVVYVTVLTLIIFLIMRIPGIWNAIQAGSKPGRGEAKGTSGGTALIVCGGLTLTIQYWMEATHTFSGINYADVWRVPLALIGWLMILCGAALLARIIAGCSGYISTRQPGELPAQDVSA